MGPNDRASHTKTPDRRLPIGRFDTLESRSAHDADGGRLRHVVGGTGRRRSLSYLIMRRNGSLRIHGFVRIRSRSRRTVCRALANRARERSHAHDEREGQSRRQDGLDCGRVGHSTESNVMVGAQRTTNRLVFFGGVVACTRISTSAVRIGVCNLVMLCLLLYRHILVLLRRYTRQAITAATQEKCSGKEHGGKDGAESGKIRTFHRTTRVMA